MGFFLLYVFFVGRCGKGHERCVGRGVHSFPVVYIFLFSCGIETNLGWGGGGLPWSGGVNKWLALESGRTWAGVGNVDISAEKIFLEWRFRWCTLSFLWGRYEKGVCACVRVWYCSFLWGFFFGTGEVVPTVHPLCLCCEAHILSPYRVSAPRPLQLKRLQPRRLPRVRESAQANLHLLQQEVPRGGCVAVHLGVAFVTRYCTMFCPAFLSACPRLTPSALGRKGESEMTSPGV